MIESVNEARNRLRSQFLARRNALAHVDRAVMSRKIIQLLVAQSIFSDHKIFFIYCSYLSEVETPSLLSYCLEQGKTVCVPLVVPEQSQLLAVPITDPSSELFPGYKGIPEPSSLVQMKNMKPEEIDIAIIPGAVFDRSGNRLGYGGGYYDRFLAQQAPQAYRIGLSYSLQLTKVIPTRSHDIPMDMLVTEQGVFTWPRSL